MDAYHKFLVFKFERNWSSHLVMLRCTFYLRKTFLDEITDIDTSKWDNQSMKKISFNLRVYFTPRCATQSVPSRWQNNSNRVLNLDLQEFDREGVKKMKIRRENSRNPWFSYQIIYITSRYMAYLITENSVLWKNFWNSLVPASSLKGVNIPLPYPIYFR